MRVLITNENKWIKECFMNPYGLFDSNGWLMVISSLHLGNSSIVNDWKLKVAAKVNVKLGETDPLWLRFFILPAISSPG